jgi:hypothetical protein
MSVITNVNRVAAKTMTMRVVAIRRDAIAVVSARGTVDGRSLITSGTRSRAWPRNDEGRWRICNNTSRKRRRRRGEVWATNAGHEEGGAVANVPPSEIIVPAAIAEDGEEGGDDGICCSGSVDDSRMEVEGAGHRDCSQEE